MFYWADAQFFLVIIECCVICVLAVVVGCHVRRCPQGWVMRLSTGVTPVRRSCDWSRTLHHTTQSSSESFSSGELMDVGESINSLWAPLLFTLQTLQGEGITDLLYRSVTCAQSSYTLRESHKLCQWCRNLRLNLSAGKKLHRVLLLQPWHCRISSSPWWITCCWPGVLVVMNLSKTIWGPTRVIAWPLSAESRHWRGMLWQNIST